MPFNLSINDQSRLLEHNVKASMYRSLHRASHKSKFVAVLSVFIGIGSALISVITRIALFAEALIKGIGNLIGSIFSKQCSWKKGLQQLSHAPLHFFMIPVSLFAAALGCVSKSFYIAMSPQKSTLEYWHAHDPQAEFEHLKTKAELGQPEAMEAVGKKLLIGKGVTQDFVQALQWLQEAAEKNQPLSMALLGSMYAFGYGTAPEDDQAKYWLSLSIEKGGDDLLASLKHEARCHNQQASLALGLLYKNGWGVEANPHDANRWLKQVSPQK